MTVVCILHHVDSGNDEQFPTSQSQFLESAIKKKLKVIKKKFNFPAKKLNSSKKIIPSYPGLRKPNAKYKHHEICALHHQKICLNYFLNDLNFFGGSLVKQLLLAEKVY